MICKYGVILEVVVCCYSRMQTAHSYSWDRLFFMASMMTLYVCKALNSFQSFVTSTVPFTPTNWTWIGTKENADKVIKSCPFMGGTKTTVGGWATVGVWVPIKRVIFKGKTKAKNNLHTHTPLQIIQMRRKKTQEINHIRILILWNTWGQRFVHCFPILWPSHNHYAKKKKYESFISFYKNQWW